MKSVRGTFQSMHVRNFRLFFTGQLISQVGNWLTEERLAALIGTLMGLLMMRPMRHRH